MVAPNGLVRMNAVQNNVVRDVPAVVVATTAAQYRNGWSALPDSFFSMMVAAGPRACVARGADAAVATSAGAR